VKLIPYKEHKTRPVGVKHETNWGGIAIYELVGEDQGDITAVRWRYEWGDTMSRMRSSKIRWAIPRRRAADGARPKEAVPYFNTGNSGRAYLDEVERCSPGWGPLRGAEYCE
jgi:hypothetical protein